MTAAARWRVLRLRAPGLGLVLAVLSCESASADLGHGDERPGFVTSLPSADAPSSRARVGPSVVPSAAAPSPGAAASAAVAGPDGATAPPLRLAFVGDLALVYQTSIYLEALERGGRVPARIKPGYPFLAVAERLRRADLCVANLECTLSQRGDPHTWHAAFRCPQAALGALTAAGIDLVNVANNHAFDFGHVGFEDMLVNLDRAKLPYFGAAVLRHQPQAPWVGRVGGVRLGLVAYYDDQTGQTVEDVRRARAEVDVLVVYPHWGQEDRSAPLELQRRLARKFIDAGADLVVGTHAHVLQPTDWYRGKLIAYGLGNFVFSGMSDTEAHRSGAVLESELGAQGFARHRLIRTRLDDDGAPQLVDEALLEPPAPPAP
jgi:hypothetical protein